MQDREGKSIRYDAAEGLPPACKGPSPSRRGVQRVLLYSSRRWRLISIFRALRAPSILNLSRLNPLQNGVEMRVLRSKYTCVPGSGYAPVAGSEWIRDMKIQDFARANQGLSRTRCHCLTEQPMILRKATCGRCFQLNVAGLCGCQFWVVSQWPENFVDRTENE